MDGWMGELTEAWDDAVELGILVMERTTRLSRPLFTGAESTEVLRSLRRHIFEELSPSSPSRVRRRREWRMSSEFPRSKQLMCEGMI